MKYVVQIPITGTVWVTVEADDTEEAIAAAYGVDFDEVGHDLDWSVDRDREDDANVEECDDEDD